jgi:hypothetical protein
MVAAVVTTGAVGATGLANSITITQPTGVTDGDLLIAVTWCRAATAGFTVVPTGWATAVGTQVAGFGFLNFWYKQVSSAASEPASYDWSGATGGARTTGLMARVTGHNTTTPIDVVGDQAAMVNAVPNDYAPAPSVTTTEADTLLLGVGAVRDGIQATAVTFIDNDGMTFRFGHSMDPAAAHDGVGLLTEARPTAGATGVKDLMVSVTNVTTGAGYILAIKSAPAASADGAVTAVAATATALAVPPVVEAVVAASANVVAVVATATSLAEAPTIGGETVISDGGPATADAIAYPPVVTVVGGGVTVVAVPGTATAQAYAPVVSAVVPTLRFEPPTFEAPIRTQVRPVNYYRLTWAASIVRIDGVLTSVLQPSTDQLTAAGVEGVDYFLGGRVYTVSAATAAELTARGYTVQ